MIERELKSARIILVLWSQIAVESDWVRNEGRFGKQRGILVAAQLSPCDLPVEFGSVQAGLLAPGAAGTTDPTWLGIVERIGEIMERPGLLAYEQARAAHAVAPWTAWATAYPSDPLFGDAIAQIADAATPTLRREIADARARAVRLEADLADQTAAAEAHARELADAARDLAAERRAHGRTKAELDQARAEAKAAPTETAAESDVAMLDAIRAERDAALAELAAARAGAGSGASDRPVGLLGEAGGGTGGTGGASGPQKLKPRVLAALALLIPLLLILVIAMKGCGRDDDTVATNDSTTTTITNTATASPATASADCSGTPAALALGASVSAYLDADDPRVAPGQSRYRLYSLSVPAGTTATVTMTTSTAAFDPYLESVGSSGGTCTVYRFDDDSAGSLGARLTFGPNTSDGTYTIRARTVGSDSTGAFTISAEASSGASSEASNSM